MIRNSPRIVTDALISTPTFSKVTAVVTVLVVLSTIVSCKKFDQPRGDFRESKFVDLGSKLEFVIRDTNHPLKMGSGNGDNVNNQLWVKNTVTGEETLLVTCRDADSMENEICDIQNPTFSHDKKLIYFQSSAWATSNSIHVFDFSTFKERFVTSGNSLDVLQSGKYIGNIVVNKHGYYPGATGGSYDHYFVVDPDGKEIIDLGDEFDDKKLK